MAHAGAEGALVVFHCSGSETTLNHWGSRNRATPVWWPHALSRPGTPTEKGRQRASFPGVGKVLCQVSRRPGRTSHLCVRVHVPSDSQAHSPGSSLDNSGPTGKRIFLFLNNLFCVSITVDRQYQKESLLFLSMFSFSPTPASGNRNRWAALRSSPSSRPKTPGGVL